MYILNKLMLLKFPCFYVVQSLRSYNNIGTLGIEVLGNTIKSYPQILFNDYLPQEVSQFKFRKPPLRIDPF